MNRLLLFCFLMMLSFGGIKAQDIHFTMFDMSPLSLNPAYAGAYKGTARIGGIYRDQWASFLRNQFTTTTFFVDAPIIRGFRKEDWVGVGMVTINDQAGSSRLRTSANFLTASYHLALDKARKNVLTLGIQGGSMSRRLDDLSLDFGSEYDPNYRDPDGTIGGFNRGVATPGSAFQPEQAISREPSSLTINAGLLLRMKLEDGQEADIGVAVGNVNQPELNFLGAAGGGSNNNDDGRPMRITVNGRYRTMLTEKVSLTPSVLFQTQKGTNEIAAQALAGYQIKENIELLAGPSFRLGDAFALMAGAQYDDLRVGLAYDFNISSLNQASNTLGGFELAAYYVIKLYKKPNVKPALLCPEF
ncbi:MAG: PorP/SprF family type IX secretion system membrane protein [Bacteroidota bacterium]